MSTASMSRKTIAAYLRLYLKNRRKKELMQQRVNNILVINNAFYSYCDTILVRFLQSWFQSCVIFYCSLNQTRLFRKIHRREFEEQGMARPLGPRHPTWIVACHSLVNNNNTILTFIKLIFQLTLIFQLVTVFYRIYYKKYLEDTSSTVMNLMIVSCHSLVNN